MAEEIFTPDELVYKFSPVSSGSLHFKVRATNDAHVALTSGPEESDPMLEIFIGGWSNAKSVIRKNRTKPDVAEVATPDILSGGEFRGFWINWSNGTVSVGKEGEATAFLEWTDPEGPLGIGYYGICTGWGASGTWLVEGCAQELSTIDGGDCLSYNFYPIRQGSVSVEVRTPSNAHITLTTAPQETNLRYEIILGGWENTASVIRKYGEDNADKVRVDTNGLLSQNEPRRFTIEWEEGDIRVRHKGDVLIKWKDPQPIGVSYFGIRTAWGASGHWRIESQDLRRTTREDEAAEELKEENENEAEKEEPTDEKEEKDEGASMEPGWRVPVLGPSVPNRAAPAAEPGWNVAGTGSASGVWKGAAAGAVPDGAVPGCFDGEQIYIARAQHEGALIPGKLVPSHGVAYVAWGGAEHGKSEYQVLCDCSPSWVAGKDGEVPPGAYPGGESEDGEVVYIGRVTTEGTAGIGKVHPSHKVCYIPYGGQELSFPDYEVLVIN